MVLPHRNLVKAETIDLQRKNRQLTCCAKRKKEKQHPHFRIRMWYLSTDGLINLLAHLKSSILVPHRNLLKLTCCASRHVAIEDATKTQYEYVVLLHYEVRSFGPTVQKPFRIIDN